MWKQTIAFLVCLLLATMDVSISVATPEEVAICTKYYGSLNYIPEKFMRPPPLLLSFPGSGNTWVRIITEYATGLYSGSIYLSDSELKSNNLTGEAFCGQRTLLVKGHPSDFYFDERSGTPELKFAFKENKKKCQRGRVHGFKKVVLLVRDPFKAILSDFQRQATGKHSGSVNPDKIDLKLWTFVAKTCASYYDESYRKVIEPMMARFKPENFVIIRYEDLLNPEKQRAELQRAIDIMDVLEYFPAKPLAGEAMIPTRLNCAFKMSDKSFAHRTNKISLIDIYSRVPRLLHDVWHLVRNFSIAMNYTSLNLLD